MKKLPEEFVFSQSALQDYDDCHRRFELRYLLDVRWPAIEAAPALQFEERMQKGQAFHHLVHQHTLGVPAAALEATFSDDELRGWWRRYLGWQEANLPVERYPELTLTTPLGDVMLMAKYDVVVKLADGTFLIVDWKTGRTPKRFRLERRMQTLVYPFVLAKAAQAGGWINDGAPIAPERIRLLYWFAETGETMEFLLTAETLQQTEVRLAALIAEIVASTEFPKTSDERRCSFCSYRSLCERGVTAGDVNEMEDDDEDIWPDVASFDLEQMEEISF